MAGVLSKGRIFYTANGHNARVFRDPSFKLLVIRGLLFASGRWKGDSKPIGFGLLGYGPTNGMGKRHGKQMIEAGGLMPVAVCDIDPERLKTAQTDFPGINTYTKLDKMLEDSAEEAIKMGIRKVNFATLLKSTFVKGIKSAVNKNPETIDPRKILDPVKDDLKKAIIETFGLLGCAGQGKEMLKK